MYNNHLTFFFLSIHSKKFFSLVLCFFLDLRVRMNQVGWETNNGSELCNSNRLNWQQRCHNFSSPLFVIIKNLMHSFISFVIMHKRKSRTRAASEVVSAQREFSLGSNCRTALDGAWRALAGAKDYNHIRNWVHYESIWWRHLPFVRRKAEHANNHLSESFFPHSTINHSDEMVFEHELWTLTRFLLLLVFSHR